MHCPYFFLVAAQQAPIFGRNQIQPKMDKKPSVVLFPIILFCCVFLYLNPVSAQDLAYKRSSLHLVLIGSKMFPQQEVVLKSWDNYPFPDKYNHHPVASKVMNPYAYEVTPEERAAFKGKSESLVQTLLRDYVEESSAGLIGRETEDMPIRINKYIQETKLAHQLVAKWFNRDEKGKFNMQLIQERGFYNASDLDAKVAAGQVRGLAALGDAGEELINYTFVVFSQLKFVENEPLARDFFEKAQAEAYKLAIPLLQEKALKAAQTTYDRTKEGYSVWTKSWLYKLRWNEEIANRFYTELWDNPQAFEQSDIFQMDYIGRDEATTLVTFSLQEKRSEEKVIDIATVRNVDKVFAKLQREHDLFKPKVPVSTSEPITAKIGMKEGLEGGEAFEVLERYQDPVTGFQKYKVVGRVVADKEKVWDNRYNAGEPPAAGTPDQTGTLFIGPKRVQAGMLLRLVR
jgi:hypothetical protein